MNWQESLLVRSALFTFLTSVFSLLNLGCLEYVSLVSSLQLHFPFRQYQWSVPSAWQSFQGNWPGTLTKLRYLMSLMA